MGKLRQFKRWCHTYWEFSPATCPCEYHRTLQASEDAILNWLLRPRPHPVPDTFYVDAYERGEVIV